MTSNAQGQTGFEFVAASMKKSAWGALLEFTLLGFFLFTPVQAAVFTVTTTIDDVDFNPGDGVCETAAGNSVCTFRAAIDEANALGGGPHQIILPPNTYRLTLVNGLVIGSSLTIIGSGASNTIIDGNRIVRSTNGVLLIPFGITVSISGVTIRNGLNRDLNGDGGGIFNSGTLTLANSTVSGNNAGFKIGNKGGGIYNDGTLTLTNSVVSGNNATSGGGIFNSGTLTLANSTVSGNNAFPVGTPAGAFGGDGGGVYNAGLLLELINSTVSGNHAGRDGGGVFNAGVMNVFNSTVTENQAHANLNGTGSGGGVYNQSGGTFNFQNTILANNQIGSNPNNIHDCSGTLTSQGYNLIRIPPPELCNVTPVTGDLFFFDPLLSPLQNNGGPTQTHAPLPGSPAIDGGNPGGCRDNLGALLTIDQRGFRRTVDGNRDSMPRCDIGAVEFDGGAGVRFYSDVDFDGDGRNDIAVYRDGTWFILNSSNGIATTVGFGGLSQDIPVPGDYDGDGRTDQGIYRDGVWFIRRSSDGGTSVLQWGGLLEDMPVPGDYDGDGKTDVAVYRSGVWFIVRSIDGVAMTTGWGGLPQDIPVPGDYDGDERTDIAVYRDGIWFVLLSSGGVIAPGWGGLAQDIPVAADYDGDGKADIAVYRDGTWFILRSSDGGVTQTGWGGLSQDVAVPGDYDGDSKADLAVYRDGVWFVLQSSNGGVTTTGWGGLPQDIPLNRRSD
jgi:hypothetical protein